MLQIAINNTLLDIEDGTTIPMEEVFGFDEFLSIPGEKSWKFSVPKTPTNRKAFGFADAPDVVWSPQTYYTCSIYIHGRLFKSGELYLEDDSETDFNVYFIGTVGLINTLFNTKKIAELNWADVTVGADLFTWAETAATTPDVGHFVFFPIVLPSLRDTAINRHYINEVEWDGNPIATETYLGFDQSRVNCMCPQVYVRGIWERIREDFGVKIEAPLLDNTEINRLVLFNLIPANNKDSDDEFLNNFDTDLNPADFVPDVELKDFLLDFAKLFNLFITYNSREGILSMFERQDLLDLPRKVWANKVVSVKNVYEAQQTINLSYKYDIEDTDLAIKFTRHGWNGTLEGIDGPNGSVDVESEISTLPMGSKWPNSDTNPSPSFKPDRPYYMPLSSASLGSDVGVKMLFYRGIKQPYNASFNTWYGSYPLATCNTEYLVGVDLSLTWKGNNSLYAKFWEKYINVMYPAKILKLTMKLTDLDLLQFNVNQVYVIDNWKCLIKKLEYNLGSKEGLVTVEVLKF